MKLFKKDYKNFSDEDLMRRFTDGDRKAFEEIYQRYESYMVNFFYRKLWQDRIKAEDFAHDLFAKLIDNPKVFNADRNFKTWLFSVANNMCKNEYKKQEIRKPTGYDMPEGFQSVDNEELQDRQVDKDSFNEELKGALANLGEKHSAVFMLRHFEGLSINEIGEVLEINAGTVKSRLHHATKFLADKLAVYRKTIP
ncbi:RNA polymerase sigma factor [Crocinitomix catalasitica]|uniref:RNA polymerase sigma factor n=1 Tax=Crocinitomix catalasitica TaxID=184607 RepID=UPI00047FB6BF|nr:RNA polymerase sigma factor [Crocinitomix catalasitica]